MPTPSRFNFKNHSLAYKLYNRTFLAHLPYLQRVKIPKAVLGCGVDAESPAQLKRNVTKDLAQFNYIGVRDQTAYNILASLPQLKSKVHLFHDLAFQTKIDTPTKSGDYAVVIPTGNGETVAKSKYWLENALNGYSNVWFVPFGQRDHDDYFTSRILSSCNTSKNPSNIVLPNDVTLTKVTRLMGLCKTVFTYRLHGLILAYILGKPCQFYPYHTKLNRVYQTLQYHSVEEIKRLQAEEFANMREACDC